MEVIIEIPCAGGEYVKENTSICLSWHPEFAHSSHLSPFWASFIYSRTYHHV